MKTRRIVVFFLTLTLLCGLLVACGSNTELAEYPQGKPEFETVADLAGKKIALTAGSVQEDEAKEYIGDCEMVYLESNTDMILAVISGKADAAIVSDTSYIALLAEYPRIARLEKALVSNGNFFGIVKNERGEKLQAELNAYLANLSESGELADIRARWHNEPDSQPDFCFDDLTDVNGTLALAGYIANAPYLHVGTDGGLRGIEAELLYGFCAAYGYGATFELPEFSSVLAGLTTGKYDIAGCLCYSDERAEVMYFSDVYEFSEDVAVVRRVKD